VLRRRWPPRFVVGFDAVAALLIVNLAVWALLDKLHAERRAEFVPDGLFGWACYLLLGLIALALVSRVQSRAAPTRSLAVVALAVSPFVLTLFWLVGDLTWVQEWPVATTAVAVLYLIVLTVRVVGAAFGPVRFAPVLLAVALVLISPFALNWLNLDTRLWVVAESDEAQDEEDTGENEALMYEQPARVAAAVEHVLLSEPHQPHAYFVGFAGDADPEVFSRETQFASQVFGTRFGTADRSVLLINDSEDRDSWPLATLSGLRDTLHLLSQRMDPEEDVLVLFLTSHGSQDGLEVRNDSLQLAQIEPGDLRQALDDSGIRWRVVVVSACYAGVFLDALKTDTTAIVTAADAAHSSFGCQEDRDLTWFGEAFLKDSLPNAASLEEAFEHARSLINEREAAEHQVHSNPQLYVGPLMRDKLKLLEAPHREGPRGTVTARR
jgi:hypothetical protein